MRHLTAIATAIALTLSLTPAGFAQSRADQSCGPDQIVCTQKGQKEMGQKHEGQKKGQKGAGQGAPGKKTAAAKKPDAPRAGDSGKRGQPFQRASTSRFKAPPRGQDYRVVNDHLVLVDSDTLKIVTVVGLLSALLK